MAFACSGHYDVSVGTGHTAVTNWFLSTVRHNSIERRAAELEVPPLDDEDMFRAGSVSYEQVWQIAAFLQDSARLTEGEYRELTDIAPHPGPPTQVGEGETRIPPYSGNDHAHIVDNMQSTDSLPRLRGRARACPDSIRG